MALSLEDQGLKSWLLARCSQAGSTHSLAFSIGYEGTAQTKYRPAGKRPTDPAHRDFSDSQDTFSPCAILPGTILILFYFFN